MKPIQHSTFNALHSVHNRGALLIELLVAISLLAIILSIGSESVYVSMQSGKTSSESDVAVGLANETLEAVRAISDEKWQNIYDLTKGAQYHAVLSGTKWATSTASELVALNTASYTRYFTVENVNRCNDTSRTIASSTTCVPANNYSDDPSTQKVIVTVSWQGSGSPVVISDYFSRWRNKVCTQTDWSGGAGSGVKNCPDTTYESISPSGTINTSGGTIKLQ